MRKITLLLAGFIIALSASAEVGKPLCLMNIDSTTVINAYDVVGIRIHSGDIEIMLSGAKNPIIVPGGKNPSQIQDELIDRLRWCANLDK